MGSQNSRRKYVLATLGAVAVVLAVAGGAYWEFAERSTVETSLQEVDPIASDFNNIPGQFPSLPDVATDGAPKRGECATLDGSGTNTKLRTTSCSDSPYRIVQIASTVSHCVQDADKKFYTFSNTKNAGWSACLDYNWQEGKCLILSPRTARFDDQCTVATAEGEKRYRATSVAPNTDTESMCPGDALVHKVRRFAICVSEV